jgi:hypothetical protein
VTAAPRHVLHSRVAWVDTDAGGRIHFTAAFRWAELAETALMRSLVLLDEWGDYPRRAVEAEYLAVLRFDDEGDQAGRRALHSRTAHGRTRRLRRPACTAAGERAPCARRCFCLTEARRAAIVTGAGTGIGRAVALALQADGYAVALVGRRREPLEALAGELAESGGSACVVAADVGDPERRPPPNAPGRRSEA